MDSSISLLSKIRNCANNFITQELAEAGITEVATSHGDIINYLMVNGNLTKKDIAEKIGKDKSTVTALIEKLDRLGFVKQEKSMKDNRYTVISLTDKAKGFQSAFDEISVKMFELEYKNISDTEKEAFVSILKKIYSNFKEAGY